MQEIRVAWWNLENLFNEENYPNRDASLAKELAEELKGWTSQILGIKLRQLASIIDMMFDSQGPDLLGVCEAEDDHVLEKLIACTQKPNRHYSVLGHASPDVRGIDVSFIFDSTVLTPSNSGYQVVIKRTATRDIFWATFRVNSSGREFVAMANHWPSRSAGQYESEPFRLLTGETVSFVLSQQLAGDENKPVLLMGDFNDEPFNRSIQEYLLGSRDRQRVMHAKNPMVYDLMWPLLHGENPGTFRYDSDWFMFDQFLASRGLSGSSGPVGIDTGSVTIFRPPIMQGSGKAPKPFGGIGKAVHQDGYSDHFPINVILKA